MEHFWEILKYTLPSVILFLTIYFVLKSYLRGQATEKVMELQANQKKEILPLRIQAYERLMMFVERINIDQLVYRIREPKMKVKELQGALIVAVQQELEHNLSQQIYISGNLWKIIELAKNEVLNHIISISERFSPEDNSGDYAGALVSERNAVAGIIEKAKDALRSEAKLLF